MQEPYVLEIFGVPVASFTDPEAAVIAARGELPGCNPWLLWSSERDANDDVMPHPMHPLPSSGSLLSVLFQGDKPKLALHLRHHMLPVVLPVRGDQ